MVDVERFLRILVFGRLASALVSPDHSIARIIE
jgi:hypothetical protein